MTKNYSTQITKKSLLFLIVTMLLCFVMAFVTACSTEENEPKDETFSKTETDELTLSNGSFEFGSFDVSDDDFPTSSNGWSLTTDNSASSSYVSSGIIDTKKWDALVNTLYENQNFKNYAVKKFFAPTDTPTEEQIKQAIKDNFETDSRTGANAKDHKVYMLNNYQQFSSSLNFFSLGTAQKLTTDTIINLTEGKYGKFSVWVKTANLNSPNADFGANIRLVNTISGTTQDEYRISNVNTNGQWKNYVIYVKAADFSDTSLTLVLGLGYGNGHTLRTDDYCEGTVYFDDVTFTEFDNYDEYVADLNASDIKIGSDGTSATNVLNNTSINTASFVATTSENNIEVEPTYFAGLDCYCSFFDMTLKSHLEKTGETYFEDLTYTLTSGYTVSAGDEGGEIKGDKFGGTGSLSDVTITDTKSPAYNKDAIKVSVTKASYNFEIKSNQFAVKSNEYVQVSFYLNTNLKAYDRTGVSVYAYDILGNTYNPSTDHTSLIMDNRKTDSDAWVLYSFIFRNNFPNNSTKNFYLSFYVGPTNVATQNDVTYYPTGDVYIADLKVSTGSVQSKVLGVENTKYDTFYLFNSITSDAVAKTNLFAGYSEDYIDNSSSQSFVFNPANESFGDIINGATSVYNQTGVTSESRYIAKDKTDYTINKPDEVNTFAGLINTKYLANYNFGGTTGAQVATELDWTDDPTNDQDNLQPIMIYNKNSANYGYFGQTQTLVASSTIVISVKVRVTGTANAYVYITDMTDDSESKLSVLKIQKDTVIDKALAVKVSASDCTENGWLTVKFYIASGDTSIKYRVELWNGARDGSENSQGFVFFDNYSTTETFTEGDVYTADSPLNSAFNSGKISWNSIVRYTRELTQQEVDFNNSQDRIINGYPEVSYNSAPIYASDDVSFVYAVYNTINPTEVDPWAKYNTEDETTTEEEDGGCVDWSSETFWLNLASILLAVVLFGAIVIVIIKTLRKRKLSSAKKIKEHYSVKSRNTVRAESIKKANEKAKQNANAYEGEVEVQPTANDVVEDVVDETERTYEEDKQEEEFVYGEVLEDFSDDVEEPTTTDDDTNKK